MFQMAITLLAVLMQAYGMKKFSPVKYNEYVVKAANESSPVVRAEAMNCYKAIF